MYIKRHIARSYTVLVEDNGRTILPAVNRQTVKSECVGTLAEGVTESVSL